MAPETASDLVKSYPDGKKSVGGAGPAIPRPRPPEVQVGLRTWRLARTRLSDLLPEPSSRGPQGFGARSEPHCRCGTARRLAERVERVLGPVPPADPARAERAAAFFRQTFEVVPDIHAHVSRQERACTRLTGPLVQLLFGLEMSPLPSALHVLNFGYVYELVQKSPLDLFRLLNFGEKSLPEAKRQRLTNSSSSRNRLSRTPTRSRPRRYGNVRGF